MCHRPVGGEGYHKFVRLWEIPEYPLRIRAQFNITYWDPTEVPMGFTNITICEMCALESIRNAIQNHIDLKEDHEH